MAYLKTNSWLKSECSPKKFLKNNADLDVKGNPDRILNV